MIKQDQLNIKRVKNKYRIIIKKTYLLFFDVWIDLTWKGENDIDEPIEFDSFKDAKEFIYMVTSYVHEGVHNARAWGERRVYECV